jgi:hypothetical protein
MTDLIDILQLTPGGLKVSRSLTTISLDRMTCSASTNEPCVILVSNLRYVEVYHTQNLNGAAFAKMIELRWRLDDRDLKRVVQIGTNLDENKFGPRDCSNCSMKLVRRSLHHWILK